MGSTNVKATNRIVSVGAAGLMRISYNRSKQDYLPQPPDSTWQNPNGMAVVKKDVYVHDSGKIYRVIKNGDILDIPELLVEISDIQDLATDTDNKHILAVQTDVGLISINSVTGAVEVVSSFADGNGVLAVDVKTGDVFAGAGIFIYQIKRKCYRC